MKTEAKPNWDQFCWDAANKAATEWFKQQSLHPFSAFYLYYRRGELGVFTEAPEGWTLGSGERLSPMFTRQQVAAKINAVARRLPFLPV